MKHKQLKAFDAVAREGSFSRAALRQCITQPALTVQVRNLEKDYGVRLFDRTAHGVKLTRQGARLFELTRHLFTVEDDIRDFLNSNYQQLTGDLKIGVDNPLVAMPLVKAYRECFPGVRLDLIPGNSQSVWLDLVEQRVDVAVVTNPDSDPRLRLVSINKTRLLVAVSKQHAWVSRNSIALAELRGQQLISREDGSNTQRFIDRVLAEHVAGCDSDIDDQDDHQCLLESERVLKVGSREMMKEAVAADLGVGFVMSGECGQDNRLHFLEVDDVTRFSYDNLIYLHNQDQRQVVSGLLDVVEKMAED